MNNADRITIASQVLMGYLKGFLYCTLWYASILAGYLGLFCPLLPALLISNKLYRYLTDVLFTFWQLYPTVLLELICGCEVQVSGDALLAGETSILVMNHRTRTDWNFLWPALYHAERGANRLSHPTKFVLKDVIKHIPGPGWVMELSGFLYIKRNWASDKTRLAQLVNYYSRLGYKYNMVLFPEGTDLTPSTQRISNEFAERNNLEKYNYVLHPRTTGFTFLVNKLKKEKNLDSLYDITLVYPDSVPQTEMQILNGTFPKQVRMHFTRFPSTVLPTSEPELKQFLEARWLEKEKVLREFHATGNFLHGGILQQDNPNELYIALLFWTVLPVFVAYVMCVSVWYRNYVVGHTIFLVGLNLFSTGFQNFEVWLHYIKVKYLKWW